jgi:hypothetical protein
MTNDALSGLDDLSGLNNESELSHLSDAISYATDIAPYRIIEIFSGVGSGKNTFVNRFVTGDPERKIPQMTVLVVTSRSSKVSEQLADKKVSYAAKIGKWGNISKEVYDDGDLDRFQANVRTITNEWGEYQVYQKSVVCTNAFVEKYLQYVYDPTDPGTHLWDLFDLIVVDEFHSLVMDASYQTAPYYVNSLIEEISYRHHLADEKEAGLLKDPEDTIRRPLCKHLILMTGTPDIVKKLPVPHTQPHILDMMDICVNVTPKNVRFLDMKQAIALIEQRLSANQRCLYFANHVLFPEAVCKNNSIDPHSVAVSFSSKDRRDTLATYATIPENIRSEDEQKFAQIYQDMVEVEKSISEDGTIPDKYKLLITTSRNKEGININSTDINDVFVEIHNISDIKQMAGRVRHGAENLYIIVDSLGHAEEPYRYECVLSKEHFAPDTRYLDKKTDPAQWSLNEHLQKLCSTDGISDFYANRNSDFLPYHGKKNHVRDLISWAQKMEYVRFDYFRNYFCHYYLKEVAHNYNRIQSKKFRRAEEDHKKYVEIFAEVFPTATIHPYKDRLDQMREFVEAQLDGDPKREFTKDQLAQHKAELNRIRFDEPDQYIKKMNTLLKLIGYEVRRVSKDSKKPGYHRWRYHLTESLQLAS